MGANPKDFFSLVIDDPELCRVVATGGVYNVCMARPEDQEAEASGVMVVNPSVIQVVPRFKAVVDRYLSLLASSYVEEVAGKKKKLRDGGVQDGGRDDMGEAHAESSVKDSGLKKFNKKSGKKFEKYPGKKSEEKSGKQKDTNFEVKVLEATKAYISFSHGVNVPMAKAERKGKKKSSSSSKSKSSKSESPLSSDLTERAFIGAFFWNEKHKGHYLVLALKEEEGDLPEDLLDGEIDLI